LSHAHERAEFPEVFRAYCQYLREVIALTPQVRWKIRLHPAENDSFYRETGLADHPQVEIQSRNISLEQAVSDAHVVCTIRSTAGLQAMIMQRPVLVIDVVPNCECSVWWPAFGGGLAVKTAESFRKALDQLICEPEFRISMLKMQSEFINKAFANKGRAAAAIVDLLEEHTRMRHSDNSDAFTTKMLCC
jgi:hypothetical protein